MKRPDRINQFDGTRPMMVWSVTDDVIENKELCEKQFKEISRTGFGGVAVFVRCSRYSWYDDPAVKTLQHINHLCRKNGIACWIGADPRFISHKLVRDSSGLDILLFGNAGRADIVPNTAGIRGGRYSIRCALSPRHVHTLTDVAVEFYPVEIERVYAFRRGLKQLAKRDIVDITADARMFYNARDRYVEAFGPVPHGIDDGWLVMAFFHVRTNHVDFSSAQHLRRYELMLRGLKDAGCSPDGIFWDEPGNTCQYGSLPYSPAIRKSYRKKTNVQLERDLWKLAFESAEHSGIAARVAYYRAVQECILGAELRLQKTARQLWGTRTVLGIHDTWHFESADMCDMNHGSMNLWETVKAKTGGFVDLGAVNLLREPESTHYSNFAAMSVVAASLGKTSKHGVAYNNLWTVGDDVGEGWQRAVMDHCVKIMALFGTRWLAHAYGPVGTVGQEFTFLGSPPLPGYPNHSTWVDFPRWNTFLSEELRNVRETLPTSNLLVLYPVETLYALADRRADKMASEIFDLILMLLDHHFHVDVLATSSVQHARWRNDQFCVGRGRYDFVLYPHPEVTGARLLRLLDQNKQKVLCLYNGPVVLESGKPIRSTNRQNPTTPQKLLKLLSRFPELRPVSAPDKCWTTFTRFKDGTIISLAPSRAGYRFEGEVTFGSSAVVLAETDRLVRFFVPSVEIPGHPADIERLEI